jgi:diketogulonate reductase-like aldo/keto reductase
MKQFPDKVGIGTYKLVGEECVSIVYEALKNGYRTIDTATLYKNQEEIMKAINLSGIPRDEIYISTKILDKTQKNETLEEELETMITIFGKLNQVLLHSPVVNKFINSYKVLEKYKRDGKILNIGVSNFKINDLEVLLEECEIKPYLNQFEVNPYCTRSELVNYCKNKGIIVQAFASLVIGRKFDDPKLIKMSEQTDIPMYKLLLKWALYNNIYVIPKPVTIQQVVQNLEILSDKICLNQHILSELDQFNEDYYTIKKHRDS